MSTAGAALARVLLEEVLQSLVPIPDFQKSCMGINGFCCSKARLGANLYCVFKTKQNEAIQQACPMLMILSSQASSFFA